MASPHRYQAFYCEENIWHLAQEPAFAGLPRRVLVISSPSRACPLWSQRAAPQEGGPVVWDYHVILLVGRAEGWRVYDLDTVLGLDLSVEAYLGATFAPVGRLPPRYSALFRVMEADDYRDTLSTDRSHMRDGQGGWLQPPPPWEPPWSPERGHNLMRLVDMEDGVCGQVMDLAQLQGAFMGAGAPNL
jgi:hypothetical protein